MKKPLILGVSALFITGLTIGVSFWYSASATVPGVNTLVSVSSGGTHANGTTAINGAGYGTIPQTVAVSRDGRYVAFSSQASNLVASDVNGMGMDVFVKDMQTGTVTIADADSSGMQAGANSDVSISGDGRYVAFESNATTLATVYSTGVPHTFVKDMQTGAVQAVNPSGRSVGYGVSISDNGRYVAYLERADGIGSGDYNHSPDVFLYDTKTHSNLFLSHSSSGVADGGGSNPVISCDGAVVAYTSNAGMMMFTRVGGDTYTQVKQGSASVGGDGLHLSCDGSSLLFSTNQALVGNDTNSSTDYYVYNIASGTFTPVDVNTSGVPIGDTVSNASISWDGNLVAFASSASSLVSGDTNNTADIFVRNLALAITDRVSMRNATTQTTAQSTTPVISAGGETVTYISDDTSLVGGDTNGLSDIFQSKTGEKVFSY